MKDEMAGFGRSSRKDTEQSFALRDGVKFVGRPIGFDDDSGDACDFRYEMDPEQAASGDCRDVWNG